MKYYSEYLYKFAISLVIVVWFMLSDATAMLYGDFSAGILPYTVRNNEVLFLLGLDPYAMNEGGWTYFSGRPDNAETPWETALRVGEAQTVNQFSNLEQAINQSYRSLYFIGNKVFSKQYKTYYSYYNFIVPVRFIEAKMLKDQRDKSKDQQYRRMLHFAWVKGSALVQCIKRYGVNKKGPFFIDPKDVVSSSAAGSVNLLKRFVEIISCRMGNRKMLDAFINEKKSSPFTIDTATTVPSSSPVTAKSNTTAMPEASVWLQLQQGKKLSKDDKKNLFKLDCQKIAASLNKLIPLKDSSCVRIASYNVHYWADLLGQKTNFDEIISVIKAIDADILILQEVNWGVSTFNPRGVQLIQELFSKLGYTYQFFGATAESMNNAPFGNLILSKYPTQQNYTHVYDANVAGQGEKHCFIHALISLSKGKQLSVYGTRLDSTDGTGKIRLAQITELIEQIHQDACPNVMIAANFNEVRAQDYTQRKNVWNLVVKDNLSRNSPTPTTVAEKLVNFYDCFTHAHFPVPKFTVWNGTTLDFIYLRDGWELPVVGCYVYVSAASDHLPIIMDVMLK